ncbi:helix-turn-helix domain-containing protein [Microbacterium sp. KR10-403]|uniref:helix-turn-helix domain-containing protein n=1 Tax=Microbacterium sp. KR10-403 TaxID=3158581 RepID=UPI0032E3AEFD
MTDTTAYEPRCHICRRPDRDAVDEAIISGGLSFQQLAERFGVSRDTLRRHKRAHMPAALLAVAAERERSGITRAADRAEALYQAAQRVLAAAEAKGQNSLSLQAVRELRGVVELLARLSGELDERPQVAVVNVQEAPEWLAVRAAIMGALVPFPEAAAAVAAALSGEGVRRGIAG